jgi:hypothetical protein
MIFLLEDVGGDGEMIPAAVAAFSGKYIQPLDVSSIV